MFDNKIVSIGTKDLKFPRIINRSNTHPKLHFGENLIIVGMFIDVWIMKKTILELNFFLSGLDKYYLAPMFLMFKQSNLLHHRDPICFFRKIILSMPFVSILKDLENSL